MDRLWSILPETYVTVCAAKLHFRDARLDLMAILAVAWGIRLTFNFARKGGYTGVEDYRWAVLRGQMASWQFQLFNFFFIVLYQNFLLVLIALPAYVAFQHAGHFGIGDVIVGGLWLLALVGETVADQQQWHFHQIKQGSMPSKVGGESGFLTSGLFKYSRHPNYFFEQLQWWLLYVLGAMAAHRWLNWSIVGSILLSVLFVGSTRFTESISSSKYPAYADYQRSTSAQIPWRPKKSR